MRPATTRYTVLAVCAVLVGAALIVGVPNYFDESADQPTTGNTAIPWQAPQTDTGTVHWTMGQQLYPKYPSLTVALDMARQHAYISGQRGKWAGYEDEMQAENPGLLLAHYAKSIQNQNPAGATPSQWFARTRSGAKITVFSPNIFIMYPDQGPAWNGSADFSAFRATETTRLLQDPVRGIWLDSMGAFSYQGPPVKPGTQTAYTLAEWIGQVWKIPVAVRAANPSATIIANGGAQTVTKPYWDRVDGVLSENCLKHPTATGATSAFPTDKRWVEHSDNILTLQAQGRFVTCSARLTRVQSDTDDNHWRRYLLASYLLTNRGGEFLEVIYHGQPPWVSGELDRPVYQTGLGTPTESPTIAGMKVAATQSGGVYCRAYATGRVCLNTGTSSGTVDGQTVPPKDAVIG